MLVTKDTDVTAWIGRTIVITNYGKVGTVSMRVERGRHSDRVFIGVVLSGKATPGGNTYIGLTYGVESVDVLADTITGDTTE
jgi:hypothetical protein